MPNDHALPRSLASLRALFATLAPPSALAGIYLAEFTGPAWLRRTAGPALALGGLRGWRGKEFLDGRAGSNLVCRGGRLQRVLPFRLDEAASLVDGRVSARVAYGDASPFPWRRIVDELRRLDGARLLGMTVIDLGALRRLAFPFLLRIQEHPDER
jgi:hypothetical protein